jgi:hypothetical protein
MTTRTYPDTIPRERATAALDLAHALLDYDDDLEPDPDAECEVTVSGETWKRFVELATAAAKVTDRGHEQDVAADEARDIAVVEGDPDRDNEEPL